MGSFLPQSEGISPIDSVLPFLYLRFQLYFPVICNHDIELTLRNGVQKLLQLYPVLSGYICQDLQISVLDEKIITPNIEDVDISQIFRVKRHNNPFKGFAQQQVPPDTLMFLDIVPDPAKPAPVLGIQLNAFLDSLVLTFSVTHRVIDANGLGTLIESLAHLCDEDTGGITTKLGTLSGTEQAYTRAALSTDYPQAIIPITLRQYVFTSIPDHSPEMMYKNATKMAALPVSRYVSLPTAKVLSLKKRCLDLLARASAPNIPADCDDRISYGAISSLSSNDVVSALLWLCISRARFFTPQTSHERTQDKGQKTSTFGMAVNIRNRVFPPLPASYMGNGSLNLKLARPLQDIIPGDGREDHDHDHSATVFLLACHIRQELNTFNNDYVRSLLAVVQAHRSTPLRVGGHYDVCCSNLRWVANLYESFGSSLGSPAHVVTTDGFFDGGCYILPKRKDENAPWDIHMTLEEQAMDWLRRDSLFQDYFEDHPFLQGKY
ncbi:transferase family-domain-containing protein [Aspergillus carlsbadensis]|nr:transferase family-domain-containing protein [Aspergillus carlsbadensis]